MAMAFCCDKHAIAYCTALKAALVALHGSTRPRVLQVIIAYAAATFTARRLTCFLDCAQHCGQLPAQPASIQSVRARASVARWGISRGMLGPGCVERYTKQRPAICGWNELQQRSDALQSTSPVHLPRRVANQLQGCAWWEGCLHHLRQYQAAKKRVEGGLARQAGAERVCGCWRAQWAGLREGRRPVEVQARLAEQGGWHTHTATPPEEQVRSAEQDGWPWHIRQVVGEG